MSGQNTGTVMVSGAGVATLSTTAKIMNVSSFTHAAGATLAFQVTPTLGAEHQRRHDHLERDFHGGPDRLHGRPVEDLR